MIRSAGARPLLFEHWSADASRVRAYCLAAARKHGGKVVLAGSAAEEVCSRDGFRYVSGDAMGGSLAGYLAACSLYATLTGRSPEGLPPPEVPFGTEVRPEKKSAIRFSPEDVRRIQHGVWATNRKYCLPLEEDK
jgi:hypothetical protein